jgi:hypothetical protein
MDTVNVQLTPSVIEALNEELAHQNRMAGTSRADAKDNGVQGQILTLEDQVMIARGAYVYHSGDRALHELRKCAALAIRALVLYGCPRRLRTHADMLRVCPAGEPAVADVVPARIVNEDLLRLAWEMGFALCRAYGDNHAHFRGTQKHAQWATALKELTGCNVVAPGPGAPLADKKCGITSPMIASCKEGYEPFPLADVAAMMQRSAERENDAQAILGMFKSFHARLCERFRYVHDEKDWRRDLCSLEEHIAMQVEAANNRQALAITESTIYDVKLQTERKVNDELRAKIERQRGRIRYLEDAAKIERNRPAADTFDSFLRVLNEACKADSRAVMELLNKGVSCNEVLANHPTIQVRYVDDAGVGFSLRPIGLINGICEALTGRKVAASIVDTFSGDALLGFVEYNPLRTRSEKDTA